MSAPQSIQQQKPVAVNPFAAQMGAAGHPEDVAAQYGSPHVIVESSGQSPAGVPGGHDSDAVDSGQHASHLASRSLVSQGSVAQDVLAKVLRAPLPSWQPPRSSPLASDMVAAASKSEGRTVVPECPVVTLSADAHVKTRHVPRVVRCADYDAMSAGAAEYVVAELRSAADARDGHAILGCATGSTPVGTYTAMVRAAEHDPALAAFFKRCGYRNLDSYVGDGTYAAEMRTHLFDPLGVEPDRTDIPNGFAPDLAAECTRYEGRIRAEGVDVQIVGVGIDGHMAFNEPGSQRDSVTRVVDLHPDTIRANARFYDGDVARVPRQAITMGVDTIMSAGKIVVVIDGEAKARAAMALLEGEPNTEQSISWLQEHPNVTVFITDRTLRAIDDLRVAGQRKPSVTPKHFFIVDDANPIVGRRIVCMSGHPDDSAIALGATLSQLVRFGNEVTTFVATTGHRAEIPGCDTAESRKRRRHDEAEAEAAILGTRNIHLELPLYETSIVTDEDVSKIARYLAETRAETVFIPSPNDAHKTHRQVAYATLLALKQMLAKSDPAAHQSFEVLYYEAPWGPFAHGAFNTYVIGTDADAERKQRAIEAHESQNLRNRYDEYAEHHAGAIARRDGELCLSQTGMAPFDLGPAPERIRRVVVTAENIDGFIAAFAGDPAPIRGASIR